MGAFCSATFVGGASAEKAVRDTENLISARVVGSDIYKLNHGETVNLPDDIKNLLSLCMALGVKCAYIQYPSFTKMFFFLAPLMVSKY